MVGGAVDDFQDHKEMPAGDVRGYDVRSGKLLWTFHTIPQAGDVGNETWKDGSWRYTGNTNVWTLMSCDTPSRSRPRAMVGTWCPASAT